MKNRFIRLKKYFEKIEKNKSQLIFLIRCRRYDLIPNHINQSSKYFSSFSFQSRFVNRKYYHFHAEIKRRLLNFVINDLNISLNYFTKKLENDKQQLIDYVGTNVVDNFIDFIQVRLRFYVNKLKNMHIKKFNNLLNSKNDLNNEYFNKINEKNKHQIHDMNNNDMFCYNNNDNNTSSLIENKHENIFSKDEAQTIRENWLVNLSDTIIPSYAKEVLSLGQGFNFKNDIDHKDFFEIFKNIEHSAWSDNEENNKFRRRTLGILNKHLHNKVHISYEDRLLESKMNKTKKFLKNNDDLMVTRADKGSITVIMKKSDYYDKVNNELENRDRYILLDKNPFVSLKNATKNFLFTWKSMGVFDDDFEYNVEITLLSKMYALIKVHKEGYPIRIVVSIVNSPLYSFDKWLSCLLSDCIKKPVASVKNSLEIKNLLSNNIIPENYVCMSLDVVGLFPNLPHYLIKDCLGKKWKYIKNNVPLTKYEFMNGIDFFLNSTYFQFQGKFYKQIFGSPIGSCSSPIFAEIVMEQLEINALNKLKSSDALNINSNYYSNPPVFNSDKVIFYKRYVDDLFLIVKEDHIDKVHNVFNDFNDSLKFTVEKERNNKISFLDIEINRNVNDYCFINWFRKETYSARFLNYKSHNPIEHKKAIVYNLVDKCIKLSNEIFHADNLNFVKKFLLANDYPLEFIELQMGRRLKRIKKNKSFINNIKKPDIKNKKKVVIPFYKYFTPKINKLAKELNFIPINKINNKFSSMIKLGKDKDDVKEKSGAIYKINCIDCDSCYIGQSSRKLKNRLNEHINDVKNKNWKSALVEHVNDTYHNFDLSNVQVLGYEKNKNKRFFYEMANIHFYKNTINRAQDTNNLKIVYKNSIDLMKKIK